MRTKCKRWVPDLINDSHLHWQEKWERGEGGRERKLELLTGCCPNQKLKQSNDRTNRVNSNCVELMQLFAVAITGSIISIFVLIPYQNVGSGCIAHKQIRDEMKMRDEIRKKRYIKYGILYNVLLLDLQYFFNFNNFCAKVVQNGRYSRVMKSTII